MGKNYLVLFLNQSINIYDKIKIYILNGWWPLQGLDAPSLVLTLQATPRVLKVEIIAVMLRTLLTKKHINLKDVEFVSLNYSDVQFAPESLIYCDIPYKDTNMYSTGSFDHVVFYKYAKQKQSEGHTVYVSEYEHNVPEGWGVVWRHESKKSIRNKDKVQEKTVEVLMTPL